MKTKTEKTEQCLKYPVFYEVKSQGYRDIYSYGKTTWNDAMGMVPIFGPCAGKARKFTSYKAALKIAKKYDASVAAYWITRDGFNTWSRVTLYGQKLLPDAFFGRTLPDCIASVLPAKQGGKEGA